MQYIVLFRASGPSEVPRFVRELIFKVFEGSQAGVRVLDNRVLARTKMVASTVQNKDFSYCKLSKIFRHDLCRDLTKVLKT